jgi:hypothetical protein
MTYLRVVFSLKRHFSKGSIGIYGPFGYETVRYCCVWESSLPCSWTLGSTFKRLFIGHLDSPQSQLDILKIKLHLPWRKFEFKKIFIYFPFIINIFLGHKHIHVCTEMGCTYFFVKGISETNKMNLLFEYYWESAIFTKQNDMGPMILTRVNSLK